MTGRVSNPDRLVKSKRRPLVDDFPNRIGKISRSGQRYFIDNRLEVEEIEGRSD
jgi:hypothetical protein